MRTTRMEATRRLSEWIDEALEEDAEKVLVEDEDVDVDDDEEEAAEEEDEAE